MNTTRLVALAGALSLMASTPLAHAEEGGSGAVGGGGGPSGTVGGGGPSGGVGGAGKTAIHHKVQHRSETRRLAPAPERPKSH